MCAARAVTVIPATINLFTDPSKLKKIKRKVAAYARVSTDTEEQLSSYEAQVDYYTRYIKSKSEWEFVGVYTDEGISATNTKKRDGFNRMIKDALAGNIDLIITKSVSRFARNTVDTLTTVRKLKEKGVEIYFEKENIYTLDSKGELLITIISSLAQEESRSISENVTWGQRKRFADGKVSLPYKHFLGYEKGEDGVPKIIESEAKIVRLIYRLFLEGKTISAISRHLTNENIPTPSGKKKWTTSTIRSILTNEKYKGDALLQKCYTIDFLTKKRKKNEGEVPQYYVKNSHEAIISPEVFDLAQNELKNRAKGNFNHSSVSPFSSKIICGECGGFYGSKVWHSNDKYRKIIWRCNAKYKGTQQNEKFCWEKEWLCSDQNFADKQNQIAKYAGTRQCNNKFKNKNKCKTPHLNEKEIKKEFVKTFNNLISNKDEVIKDCENTVLTLINTEDIDSKISKLQEESEIIVELMKSLIYENSRKVMNQDEYNKKYDSYTEKYEKIKSELSKLEDKKQDLKVRTNRIKIFIENLKSNDKLIDEFDEQLWYALVDKAIVYEDSNIKFILKNSLY